MEQQNSKMNPQIVNGESLNSHSQRRNNNSSMNLHKYNNNNNLEAGYQYSNFSLRSNNDYYRNEISRINHNRSKSNIDSINQQLRRRISSTEDYNPYHYHSRSKSNGQVMNINNYRRPERMGSKRNRDRTYEGSSSGDNYSNPYKTNTIELNNTKDVNDNIVNNKTQIFPPSSPENYNQNNQVNTSSPLSKQGQFQDEQEISSSSLNKNTLPTIIQHPPPTPSTITDSIPNNASVSSLNLNALPVSNHLTKNDSSSTSIFSEVSISSTNNHYRFTGNINNNYVGGNENMEIDINNNRLAVPNNDLDVFDDNVSQTYYSSDEDNNNNNSNNKNENGYYSQNNIPLVERVNPPQITQVEKPDNVERDRYGFKISYQYISRESQMLFQKNYQPILERRKSRWNSLIKENGGHLPQKISKKLKRFIHKGIPQDLRPMCWFKYSGAERMQQEFPHLYKYLLDTEISDKKQRKFSTPSKIAKSIEEIEKDLYRTFPDNEKFSANPPSQDELENNKNDPNAIREIKNPYIRSLRNILVAFSYYSIDPSQGGATSDRHSKYTIGYCQSLNYIAGLLLLIFAGSKGVKFPEQSFQVEEKCFWMMIALVDEILPIELYEERQMQGAQIEQDVLWDNLVGENGKKYGLNSVAEWVAYMERDENIHNKSKYANWNTGGTMPALKSITLPWMLTCFVGVLPIETVLRVWDCLFTEGSKILIRVILTLFRIFKNDITNISDGMVAWTFIKNMPHRIINCHEFMEICFRPIIYISSPVSLHSSDGEQNHMDYFDEPENSNHIQSFSNQFDMNEPKSKKTRGDSYHMNYKKRGIGKISQKSIDKFRKQQWNKEQNKK